MTENSEHQWQTLPSSRLFRELSKLIPNLPATCRKMVFTLEVNKPPIVECEFFVADKLRTTSPSTPDTERDSGQSGEIITQLFELRPVDA